MFIQIFSTGGTIDKVYFDALSEFQIGEPMAADILQQARVGFEYKIESLTRKDSLELTDEDRDLIHAKVAACPYEHILITHGTDGMVATGQALKGIFLLQRFPALFEFIEGFFLGQGFRLFLPFAFQRLKAVFDVIDLGLNNRLLFAHNGVGIGQSDAGHATAFLLRFGWRHTAVQRARCAALGVELESREQHLICNYLLFEQGLRIHICRNTFAFQQVAHRFLRIGNRQAIQCDMGGIKFDVDAIHRYSSADGLAALAFYGPFCDGFHGK